MQTRKVVRVVDALRAQRRIIYTLDCGHFLSLTTQEIEASDFPREHYLAAGQARCFSCPDPEPERAERLKSANQLWKEAGEP